MEQIVRRVLGGISSGGNTRRMYASHGVSEWSCNQRLKIHGLDHDN